MAYPMRPHSKRSALRPASKHSRSIRCIRQRHGGSDRTRPQRPVLEGRRRDLAAHGRIAWAVRLSRRDGKSGPMVSSVRWRRRLSTTRVLGNVSFSEGTMICSSLFRSLTAAALAVSVALPAGAQSVVGKGKTGPVPNPVTLDTTGMFQAKFVERGRRHVHRRPAHGKGAPRSQGQGRDDDRESANAGGDGAGRVRRGRAREGTRDQVCLHPDARHGRESVRAEGTRHLRGGDGVGGWQGAPALHDRVAGESSLGRLSDS